MTKTLKYRAKRVLWENLNFEELANFYLNSKNREECCFLVQNRYKDIDMVITYAEVIHSVDIIELKCKLLFGGGGAILCFTDHHGTNGR